MRSYHPAGFIYFIAPFLVFGFIVGDWVMNYGWDLALFKTMESIGMLIIVLFLLYIGTVIAVIIENGIRTIWKERKEERTITGKEIKDKEFDFEGWGR